MKRLSLCNDWQFTESCTDEFLNFKGQYPNIRIPHTTAELPLHYAVEQEYQMVCGYRRKLDIPAEWKNKRIFLRFDGAAHAATVYVNGKKAAVHLGGYTSFTVELTGLTGTCNLAVELDSRESLNIPPFGYVIDYMTFGGLYREVWLDVAELCYVKDVFVKTPDMNKVILDISIERPELAFSADITIKDAVGSVVYNASIPKDRINDFIASFECDIPNTKPWSPETPYLYTLEISLKEEGGAELDNYHTRFGFRQGIFRADGFFLNGKSYKIRGLNRHQSYPYVGYAMPSSIQRHDVEILKNELHCNAVRTSHYPQSQSFLNACDELGLLVFTELPGWQHIGDEEWKKVACENLRELIMQSRNHPSIILWGVRVNESQDDDDFYKETNNIARELDTTRQTSGVRYLWKSSLLEDVYAFNDFSHVGVNGGLLPKQLVSSDKNKGYLISEYNGHMYPTKSFDTASNRLDHALRHATVLDAIYGRKDVAGGFGWCMADYYTHGDFGSGDRICYHGVLDMFRNPKLAASVYSSCQDNVPVLAIGSDMHIGDYPAGSVGENYAITNADSVRFYKNNTLTAEFPAVSKRWKNLRHPPVDIGDVIGDAIEKGEGWSRRKAQAIKASLLAIQRYGVKIPVKQVFLIAYRALRWFVGPKKLMELYQRYCNNWGVSAPLYRYDAIKDGKTVASVTRQSNAQLHLEAKTSATNLVEGDYYDVAAVRIRIADKNGETAAYCQLPVRLEISGEGQLIGPSIVTAEGGMCGTYVKTTGASGDITLTISTEQTDSISLTFKVHGKEGDHGE